MTNWIALFMLLLNQDNTRISEVYQKKILFRKCLYHVLECATLNIFATLYRCVLQYFEIKLE